MNKVRIADWSDLEDRSPSHALVANVDLVIVRFGEEVSVLYGRCLHRGALMVDGFVRGDDLICGVHHWDYQLRTGVSSYNPKECLHRFSSWIEEGGVWVDEEEIGSWEEKNPQAYDRDSYQGAYQDHSKNPFETKVKYIRSLASDGLERVGHHGPVAAMGVPIKDLPTWDDLQFVTAQLARVPQLDEVRVGTDLVVGPRAAKPLHLEIPIIVSDMSFGALSFEAKVALSKGAELAGTGICSGEGGMLPEEQQANGRYFYELASGRFGFSFAKLAAVQAFHFKGGQGAKTGTGGHLPGHKVVGRIAEVRKLPEGGAGHLTSAVPEWEDEDGFRHFADEVRERTGGIPIGFKLSAQHIEDDMEAALRIGVDYIILDGRGGGTGAAPQIFRDNISVPTLPALARARRLLDERGKSGDVTLFITGGLRTPADFAKALALGADGIAVSNAALQAIGCLGMRACHTDNCPVGIATQKEHLRARLPVDEAADRLARFFGAAVELMEVLNRACGHTHLDQFRVSDLTTWKRNVAYLTGVHYGGVVPL